VFTSTGDVLLQRRHPRQCHRLCHDHGIPVTERDFGLEEALGADEAFVTGTLGGIDPGGCDRWPGLRRRARPGHGAPRPGSMKALKDADARRPSAACMSEPA
jgi:hypothetical protein